jgi:hypothetical protein
MDQDGAACGGAYRAAGGASGAVLARAVLWHERICRVLRTPVRYSQANVSGARGWIKEADPLGVSEEPALLPRAVTAVQAGKMLTFFIAPSDRQIWRSRSSDDLPGLSP